MFSYMLERFGSIRSSFLKWLSGLNDKVFLTQQQLTLSKKSPCPLLGGDEELTRYFIHQARKQAK